MNDREIDDILRRAAQAGEPVDPALLQRIAGTIGRQTGPVRPLPPRWMLTGGLFLAAAAIALAGAAHLGLAGVERLAGWQRALIFPALAILTWLAASAWVGERIPGSRRAISPIALMPGVSAVLLVIFALMFRDYATTDFVQQGMRCLSAGLLYAIPAAVLGWFILRRGFAVDGKAAGIAAGLLSSMAGVGMLELHCVNFEAPHVMLWHTAVIPLCALVGGWLGGRTRSRARAS